MAFNCDFAQLVELNLAGNKIDHNAALVVANIADQSRQLKRMSSL